MFRLRVLLAILAVSALAGCATPTPEMIANNDPFEPQNRKTLEINAKIENVPAAEAKS